MQVINYFYYKNKSLEIKNSKDNILSHNKMQSFFSGTDTATLREEGNKRNHFVSLIVNNAGTYTAGITRKLTSKSVVTKSFTYGTFEGNTIEGSKEYEVEEATIEWCNLDIIKEGFSYSFCELDKRLEEIKKEKAKRTPSSNVQTSPYQTKYNGYGYGYGYGNYSNAAKAAKKDIERYNQPTLFDYDYMDSEPPFKVPMNKSHLDFNLTDNEVHSMLLQLITGSIVITDESKIDAKRWTSSMEKIFDKRFNKNITIYKAWAEQFCEFLVYYPTNLQYMDVDEVEYASAVAMALISELKNLPKNKYIDVLIDCLGLWTM